MESLDYNCWKYLEVSERAKQTNVILQILQDRTTHFTAKQETQLNELPTNL